MTVFGYLILISIGFYDFTSLVLIEKIYQTLKTVFEHSSKNLEVHQKYSATRRIFNSLLCVWKCGQTWSFVFDILHETLVFFKTHGTCASFSEIHCKGKKVKYPTKKWKSDDFVFFLKTNIKKLTKLSNGHGIPLSFFVDTS